MNLVIGNVICAVAAWIFLRMTFYRVNFVQEYERAAEQDYKKFRDGMTMEEAHRNRDKVMKRARIQDI